MKEITGEEFAELLYSKEVSHIYNYRVIENRVCTIDLDRILFEGDLENIHFEGKYFNFRNGDKKITKPEIRFLNCHFSSSLNFTSAVIGELTFGSCTYENKRLGIYNCDIDELDITNFKFIGSEFFLSKSTIKHTDIENLIILDGILKIWNCDFEDFFSIANSQFKHIDFNHSKFNKYFDFITNKTSEKKSSQLFRSCEFGKSSFFKNSFPEKVDFIECNFLNSVNFSNLKIITSNLIFLSCIFEKHVHFNDTSLYKLVFESTKFNDILSFQSGVVNILEIDKTIFEKTAAFDELKILDVKKCTRKTIRNIKLQLQKAENKIDYNRFRAYELSAYYTELKWFNWKDSKDKFILAATWLSTGFEHSWRRALVFTIISGLLWYSGLYFLEYHGSYNPEKINDFFTGAFRFFLITDFYSPFEERKYLTDAISWLPFVIGKIFIAFGIYEMIQAFRKFKA